MKSKTASPTRVAKAPPDSQIELAWNRRRFLRDVGGISLFALAGGVDLLAQAPAGDGKEAVMENEVLRLALSSPTGVLTVTDKRNGQVWRQQAKAGYQTVEASVSGTGTALSAKGTGAKGKTSSITISFTPGRPYAFDLSVQVPDRKYTLTPEYPLPFVAPDKGWYYVQNTVGEGILMPMDEMNEIKSAYGLTGSQPWWGITDLNRAMRARLETFAMVDGVYADPLRINYAFFTSGGYVSLAKEFRADFLHAHPDMRPLQERVQARPAVGHLKDSVYVYLWGKSPEEDLALVQEMKAAGIDRGIAVTYGRHETTRATSEGVKQAGWVPGKYHMPTGNRFKIYRRNGFANALVSGRLGLNDLINPKNPDLLGRVCGKQILAEWPEKAKALIDEYGVELFYFDTLSAQIAPCVDPRHPETVEENQAARVKILKETRKMGMIVGSGEGLCPAWALAGVDFFEGQMSLRDYHNTQMSVPSGEFEKDLGHAYDEAATSQLDPVRRIPLYQLGFHDYVVGTWVWRDTNFQSTPYAWKKNLFNILYGTMPMWHINRNLWNQHKTEMVASYRDIQSVRQRIGFAEMINHGWLSPDRSVQFTDWSTGDRVIVNFGDQAFDRMSSKPIPPRSFALEQGAATS